MHAICTQAKERMQKCMEDLRAELGRLRGGRASLALLEPIRVDYYGNAVPLNQVATLNIPEPRLITIQPWESSMVAVIEKAILKASLGLTPVNDGKCIRLPMPPLTEERRKEMVKLVKKVGEEHRVAVRTVRRDAMEEVKRHAKAASLPEDETKRLEQEIQKLTDAVVQQVDEAVVHKEREILTM